MIIPLRRYSTNALQNAFKLAMAHVSSQAMILTAGTTNGSSSSLNNHLHGMTLSSTTSLSVSPTPLLAFNLHLPSYTSTTLHELKYMALHILPPTEASVQLGKNFASGIKPVKSENDDGELHEKTTPFTSLTYGAEWSFHDVFQGDGHTKIHVPILNHAERIFICKKRRVFEIDMHEIWAVEVVEILNPNSLLPEEESQNTGGILYYNRNFHKIGNKLT